jgi:hypothetical protein
MEVPMYSVGPGKLSCSAALFHSGRQPPGQYVDLKGEVKGYAFTSLVLVSFVKEGADIEQLNDGVGFVLPAAPISMGSEL